MANKATISVSPGLTLNRISVYEAPKTVLKPEPTHHIIVIDCSGSMSGELPRIRAQIKNKLATLVQENDKVSIIWFSSRGECGSVVEKVVVSDAKALSQLAVAVDRWLKPVGCTGFVDPIRKVKSLCDKGEVHSMLFLTDGNDNCWTPADILKATRELSGMLSSATFVEYGWYCNRKLLADMAEEVGGSLVSCENFDNYEPVFSSVMSRGNLSAKWVSVEIPHGVVDGLVYTTGDSGPIVFKVENGTVSVPEKTDSIFFFSSTGSGDFVKTASDKTPWEAPLRQAAVALSQRGKSATVYKILEGLGDVHLFKKYANAFGKQAQSDFQKLALNSKSAYAEGAQGGLHVDEDAFTALDLLSILMEDDGNLLMIGHEEYSYNRIGRKTEAAPTLTEEDKANIADALAYAKKASDVQKALAAVPVPVELEFTPDVTQGVAISSLTWNETRPNVSAGFLIYGSVTTPEQSPMGATTIPTTIFRNHAFIKDGIINVDKLPVQLTRKTAYTLKGAGVLPSTYKEGETVVLDLRALPVINRRMVGDVSAESLIRMQYDLTKYKAAQRVYNKYAKAQGKAFTGGAYLASQFGDEGAAWLAGMGLTDKGFNPKVVKAPATDFYMGLELTVTIDKLGSLAKVEDVEKKIDTKKALTPREALMLEAIMACRDHKEHMTAGEFEAWVRSEAGQTTQLTRDLMRLIAEIKFSVLIGQVWFKEFASTEEHDISVVLDGVPTACSIVQEDKRYEI